MLKKRKFYEKHSVPDLLGRCKIGLPPAGAKINNYLYIQEGLFSFIHVFKK